MVFGHSFRKALFKPKFRLVKLYFGQFVTYFLLHKKANVIKHY
jgi:hypothetical protein